MDAASVQSDFLAARAKTAVTIMNATGWQQGIVNAECVSVDSVFFYVYDYQTKWIWCCSIPRDAFYAVVKQSEAVDQSHSIAFCGHMIDECAAGNGLNPDKENELAIALTAYISITKSYQLTDCAKKQNHFVVIRYGATDTLRPFAMSGPARHLVPAEFVEAAMQKVIAMDSQNHPEWIESHENSSPRPASATTA
ncbi:hypothetical protein [Rhodoferax antarcticus]|uniref:Uncharacterized protein n=1 Tax=Rhodoferax antarcticus ANT.BR TaxID=1111071 RepID=A0A1Q8Y8V8_9BURK|nr:hypothetical protein [Rhodoferax antarcticus]OLP04455.1 hypothetical protein BLL52_4247 [Rhodoferax antarcticus ANT.BR]